MTGAHPKVVQTGMRHSSITLTMDTYGHLFPGQEADAVGRMREMLVAPPEAMRATGTDGAAANASRGAQHQDIVPGCTFQRRPQFVGYSTLKASVERF